VEIRSGRFLLSHSSLLQAQTMPQTADMLTLSMQPARDGGASQLACEGEIDLVSAPVFEQALLPSAARGPVRVDLTAVKFLDSAGMAVLLKASRLTGRDGCLVVCQARSQPERVLMLSRFDVILQMEAQEQW